MTDEVPQQTKQKILEALESGDKIEAIRLYRDATGGDLADAKRFVDGLQAHLAGASDAADGAAGGRGCLAILLAAAGLALVSVWAA